MFSLLGLRFHYSANNSQPHRVPTSAMHHSHLILPGGSALQELLSISEVPTPVLHLPSFSQSFQPLLFAVAFCICQITTLFAKYQWASYSQPPKVMLAGFFVECYRDRL